MAFFQVLCPWDFQQIAFENCDLEKKQTWKHGIFFLVGMFFYCPLILSLLLLVFRMKRLLQGVPFEKQSFWNGLEKQGWVKTGISQDKTIQDRDKILKLKTRQLQDSHIAVKTIQDFQVIKNFGSRQVKNFNFSKFTRQDRSRQDSCQEISRKIQEIANFLLLFGPESWSVC